MLDTDYSINSSVQSSVLGLAITAALIVMLITAVVTRGSIPKILGAGLAAGIFLWIIFNVTQVRDLVGKDLDAEAHMSRIPSQSVVVPAPVSGLDTEAADTPTWA